MNKKVEFISLDEDDTDLIVSFAIADSDWGVKSLILMRTPVLENMMEADERGVNVSFDDDDFGDQDRNMLREVTFRKNAITVVSTFSKYELDVSDVDNSEIEEMIQLLKKQNFDNRFTIRGI